MHKTAVVILNWNGIDYLKKFLGNVVNNTEGDDILICVADNGSTDGSGKWVADNFPVVKLIRFDKNYGFAEGYNHALEQIEAKYYVLLNSDVEVQNGWLQPMIDVLDMHPDIAACQPKVLSYNTKDYFEYAGAAGGYIDKNGYPFCRGRIFSHVEKDNGQYNDPADIFWSSGACMMVRADAWHYCKGLDADFFAHMEEIDMCWRLQKAGYRIRFVPDTAVYHVGGGALPYNSPFKTYLNFRNSLWLLYKNLPDEKLNIVLFRRKILDIIAMFLFLFKGQFENVKSVFKAHRDYYKELPKLKEKRKAVIGTCINTKAQILNKNIVFEFYIKRNKTYSSL